MLTVTKQVEAPGETELDEIEEGEIREMEKDAESLIGVQEFFKWPWGKGTSK